MTVRERLWLIFDRVVAGLIVATISLIALKHC